LHRLRHAARARIAFAWNNSKVEGRAGDTIAAALYASGIRAIARSRKQHRLLGLSGSYLSGVLGRVNGRPNVRLDLEPAAEGLDVRMQNVWPSAGFDLLAAAQFLPSRWLHAGFEHTRLLPSGTWRFQVWERLLAFLAGMSPPPSSDVATVVRIGRLISVDTVVVGGGPAGRAAANDAVHAGQRTTLVSRGAFSGRYARACGVPLPDLDPRIELITGCEVFGLYREGSLVVAAPHNHAAGAVVLQCKRVVLATGRCSIPPLVPGNHVPGVLDAYTALLLANDYGVAPGDAVVMVGTGDETPLAERLRALGVNVIHVGPVTGLRRIIGRGGVKAVQLDRIIPCDALVHAGPWRADPGLLFQAKAEGLTQLALREEGNSVVAVGAAAAAPEPVAIGDLDVPKALLCPCMDVAAGELLHWIEQGEADVEVLKRVTACGMGPCQGMPCWETLAELVAKMTARPVSEIGRPSHRPPRRALTVAQAAGLDCLVEPDR
jgi:sarcosine oxidase, subunit alpha